MKQRSNMLGILPMMAYILVVSYLQEASAKNIYYMDRSSDCGIGTYDVQRDQEITIYGRTEGSQSTQGACTINFRAVDSDATLVLEFITFSIQGCNKVTLYLSGNASPGPTSYGCGDSDPSPYATIDRSITITLHKTEITNMDFNFQLKLKAFRDRDFPPPGDSNPAAVGLVVGLVGGVFGVIIIVAIIGICCFRKYRARGPSRSPYLHAPNSKTKLDEGQSPVSVGFTNESMHGSPMSKRKLLAPSDSSDEKGDQGSNRPKMSNYQNNGVGSNIRRPVLPEGKRSENVYNETNDVFGNKAKRERFEERSIDVKAAQPRNPMLGAFKSNSKFRDTFEQTEREAENRAQRVSSTSSFETLGVAPTPPDSTENLSRSTLPPVPTSRSGQTTTKMGKNPRTNSLSSDELKRLDKKLDDSDTSSDIVPKKVTEKEMDKKANTSHALKPDRKGKKGGRKQSASSVLDVDPQPSPRNPREKEIVKAFEREINDNGSQNGSGRYRQRTGRKSPRQQGRSSGGKGFSHRRGRSADPLDSRPTTPLGNYGSMEDLESLPPLKRAGSKNSLYSSRSSLYDRRGRRRKGSYSESVISYGTTRDDISVGRSSGNYDSFSEEDDFDGYEKPLSRRDRERLYRSDNDLGRRGRGKREISTQTLRETATQTGPNESVDVQPKMLVKKRRRSKSLSTAGTQTSGKKSEEGKSKKKADKDSNVDTDDERKAKRKSRRTKSAGGSEGTLKGKRSKSVDALDVDENRPRTKPKPAPRKSTSALKDNTIGGSTEKLDNPYYPQSEGFVAPNYYPQGYPMAGPPGYPGQSPPLQAPYPGGMPNYPPNGLPQQLPMMNGAMKPVPRGPKKSNWEMLCEMTDGKRQEDPSEVGSIASSVFTNNPSNYPPMYPGHPIQGQAYYGNQGYYPPPQGSQYIPGGPPMPPQYDQHHQYPQYNVRAQSVPDFMHDLSGSVSSEDTQEREEKRQATIEQLKAPVKPQAYRVNVRTESVV